MLTHEKDLASTVLRINVGVYLVFFGLWMVALNAQYWFSSFSIYTAATLAAIIASCVMVFFGLKGLSFHQAEIKANGIFRRIKVVALAPNIVGFALLGVGSYLLSILNSNSIQLISGGELVFFSHPYASQALMLFVAGSAVVFLAMFLYFRLIPDQNANEATV